MVEFVDFFVIKVSFDGRDVIMGRYSTFNEADDVAGELLSVELIDAVRVELWSNRIAVRYGMPIERVRIEKLLDRLSELEKSRKSRKVTLEEAVAVSSRINRMILDTLKKG